MKYRLAVSLDEAEKASREGDLSEDARVLLKAMTDKIEDKGIEPEQLVIKRPFFLYWFWRLVGWLNL